MIGEPHKTGNVYGAGRKKTRVETRVFSAFYQTPDQAPMIGTSSQ